MRNEGSISNRVVDILSKMMFHPPDYISESDLERNGKKATYILSDVQNPRSWMNHHLKEIHNRHMRDGLQGVVPRPGSTPDILNINSWVTSTGGGLTWDTSAENTSQKRFLRFCTVMASIFHRALSRSINEVKLMPFLIERMEGMTYGGQSTIAISRRLQRFT